MGIEFRGADGFQSLIGIISNWNVTSLLPNGHISIIGFQSLIGIISNWNEAQEQI